MQITYATLRSYKEGGLALLAHCTNYRVCSHSGAVSVDALIQRLGWDFDVVAGRRRIGRILYCSVCGQYHPELLLTRAPEDRPVEHVETHPKWAPVPIEESVRRHLALQQMARERDAAIGLSELPSGGRVRKFGPGR